MTALGRQVPLKHEVPDEAVKRVASVLMLVGGQIVHGDADAL